MGVTWEPILDSYEYLKRRNPEQAALVDPTAVFPFFIRLLEEPFEGWIVEITAIEEKKDTLSFVTRLDLVPKDVTPQQEKKLQKKLNQLLSNIVNDIMKNALNTAKELLDKK
jgi:hypothetical protein